MAKNILTWWVLILSISACFERKEGCLDTLAANFDVEALDPCEACCSYPNLIFRFQHMYGDSTLRAVDTFTNDLGQLFNVVEVRYYLSDVTLWQNSDSLRVIPTITNNTNTLRINDDIKIARSNSVDLPMGSFISFGEYQKVTFRMGVDNAVLQDSFINLPTQHPLTSRNKMVNAMGNPVQMSIRYTLINPDTLRNVWVETLSNNTSKSILQNVLNRKGENIIFDLKANYEPLFKTIDLSQNAENVGRAMSMQASNIFD